MNDTTTPPEPEGAEPARAGGRPIPKQPELVHDTAPKEPRAPREGSSMHAALTVLQGKRKPMTPQELYDEAVKRGLLKNLTGKTPVATLAAQLAVANKAGRFVERPEPGRYQLRHDK